MGLIRDLSPGPIAVDTCVFIYYIEEHGEYLPLVEPVFAAIDAGSLPALTTALTLLEVLVVPYRRGDRDLAGQYEALLTRSRGLLLIDLARDVLREAARLRAETSVRTPDAIQLATARLAGARTFLTNDRRLPDLPELEVRRLRDYLP